MSDLTELAALNALGLLDPQERAVLEQGLEAAPDAGRQDVQSLEETAEFLGLAVPLVNPPARLRERLMARIHGGLLEAKSEQSHQVWKEWTPSATGSLVVRHGDEGWQKVSEGVWAKQLFVDPARDMATMLIRMEPGAAYVPHLHGGPEQCFVLEGDIHDGEQVYRKGDFQCLPGGSTHGVQWTEAGCTLLIVSSLHDQLL
jgi:quercetin dioxygenase-like cupin family protein